MQEQSEMSETRQALTLCAQLPDDIEEARRVLDRCRVFVDAHWEGGTIPAAPTPKKPRLRLVSTAAALALGFVLLLGANQKSEAVPPVDVQDAHFLNPVVRSGEPLVLQFRVQYNLGCPGVVHRYIARVSDNVVVHEEALPSNPQPHGWEVRQKAVPLPPLPADAYWLDSSVTYHCDGQQKINVDPIRRLFFRVAGNALADER